METRSQFWVEHDKMSAAIRAAYATYDATVNTAEANCESDEEFAAAVDTAQATLRAATAAAKARFDAYIAA